MANKEITITILKSLNDLGVYNKNKLTNLKLSDLIQDSLTYISFFADLEEHFDFSFPDEIYTSEIYSLTLEQLTNKIEGFLSDKFKKRSKGG